MFDLRSGITWNVYERVLGPRPRIDFWLRVRARNLGFIAEQLNRLRTVRTGSQEKEPHKIIRELLFVIHGTSFSDMWLKRLISESLNIQNLVATVLIQPTFDHLHLG